MFAAAGGYVLLGELLKAAQGEGVELQFREVVVEVYAFGGVG
jgi:hypothetical protein